jgi:hypothetical protein
MLTALGTADFRPLIAISRAMTREIAIKADEPRERESLAPL